MDSHRALGHIVEPSIQVTLCRLIHFTRLSSSYYNKIRQTGWLKQQTLISQWFWRLANSRSRFWQILCLWSEPASWLVDGHLLAVCSRAFFLEHMHGEGRRGSKLSGVPSYKGTNPILRGPPSWPHLNPVTSQRPPSKCLHIGEQGFNIRIWGEDTDILFVTTNLHCEPTAR